MSILLPFQRDKGTRKSRLGNGVEYRMSRAVLKSGTFESMAYSKAGERHRLQGQHGQPLLAN